VDTENVDVKTEKTEASSAAKACKIAGCKRPYQAKGYCTVHYHQWRQGKLPKPRYKTCNYGVKKLKRNEKKECLKKIFRQGLCEEHFKASLSKQKEAPPPAPTAASTPES
jgi:hypothetical protein